MKDKLGVCTGLRVCARAGFTRASSAQPFPLAVRYRRGVFGLLRRRRRRLLPEGERPGLLVGRLLRLGLPVHLLQVQVQGEGGGGHGHG